MFTEPQEGADVPLLCGRTMFEIEVTSCWWHFTQENGENILGQFSVLHGMSNNKYLRKCS